MHIINNEKYKHDNDFRVVWSVYSVQDFICAVLFKLSQHVEFLSLSFIIRDILYIYVIVFINII